MGIYVCDNPRETCMNQFVNSIVPGGNSPETLGWKFDAFAQAFLSGYIPYGTWSEHVLGWEDASVMNDILWCFIGDFQTSFSSQVKEIAEYLDIDLTEEKEKEIKSHQRKRGKSNWKQFFSKTFHKKFV